MATTALARELLFTSGGFTKLADRLVAAGFVSREPCATDRRVTYLTLTKEGRALAQRALKAHAAGIRRRVLAVVGEEKLAPWREAAGRLRDEPRGALVST
ncbi:MAG TPA: MarR family transcriptional regulator [Chloroflexota bacterium]|nr:MarR family transcriptional regulator [Chloroflexota bacterium]